jgi:CDP-diacylglycerol--serine O-phosphatidyltransferase
MASFNRRKDRPRLKFPRLGRNKLAARQGIADDHPAVAKKRRGIYLLPNAFTTGALFCGFYAIVMAMNHKFDHAAIAIFAAMILDGIDGRVARLINAQSEFGAQYDSLSDMVSFGAAPSLVIYQWSLLGLNKMGWLAAFIYCSGAALRLARFNTNIEVVDKRFFQGLPSPAAAALVAGFIWAMEDLQIPGAELTWVAWGITVFAGLTMVSNVPFYSFKDVNFRKVVPFITIFVIVLIFVLISYDPPKVMFSLFVLYGISGYVAYFWRLIKGKPVSIVQIEVEEKDEH